METKTLECPIIGLIYTEHTVKTSTYYALAPDDTHKMRVRSMDTEDEERNVVPCYLRRLVLPRPYDFVKNDIEIESEAI